MTTPADLNSATDAETSPVPDAAAYTMQTPAWYIRIIQLWGKVRRWYLIHLRPGYVEKSLARRRGQCRHSGACCHLAFTCPWHGPDEHGDPGCTVYEKRPQNCRVFPIDERDLRDRDYTMPDHPCGFSFVPEQQAADEREAGVNAEGTLDV